MNKYITFEEAAKAFSMQTMWSYRECLSMLKDAYAKGNINIEDVKPVVHGEWGICDWIELDTHGFGVIRYPNAGLKCSNCHYIFKRENFCERNYCPNCGAEMDKER